MTASVLSLATFRARKQREERLRTQLRAEGRTLLFGDLRLTLPRHLARSLTYGIHDAIERRARVAVAGFVIAWDGASFRVSGAELPSVRATGNQLAGVGMVLLMATEVRHG